MNFVSANNIEASPLEADVIIVGTGAAGLPLACELIGSSLKVVVLESGDFEMDGETQALAEGEVAKGSQHGSLSSFRKRVFGGTTSVWGGRCAPFDDLDFQKRDYVPFSGWPISRADLDPYYERAHHYLDLGVYSYRNEEGLDEGEREVIPGLPGEIWKQDTHWKFSLPTHLGKSCRSRVSDSPNIQVVFQANATQLLTNDDGSQITGVEVATLEGRKFEVMAPRVVVAAGGLESTRLLLASNRVNSAGLGNTFDQLGRYYSSHVSGDLGEVSFKNDAQDVHWIYEKTSGGIYAKRNLRLSEEVQKKHGLLNARFILTHPSFADASHGNSVLSAAYLAKRFFKGQIPPEYSKELSAPGFHSVPQHFRNVVFGIPSLIKFSLHWFFKRIIAKRKYPSISLKSKANCYTIHFDSEQTPNPESRVMLSEQKDRFGMPLVKVAWQYVPSDLDSVMTSYKLLRDELTKGDLGIFTQTEEESETLVKNGFGVGSHHIGTTRMSDDPHFGVVDANCQVHGVKGLFVSSPSTFPTGSFANPVLTTVALAIRLADFIKTESA